MNVLDLIEELEIRFNTSPKLYEKQDYKVLIETIKKLAAGDSTIEEITSLLPKKLTDLIDDLGDAPVHTHSLYVNKDRISSGNITDTVNTNEDSKIATVAQIRNYINDKLDWKVI